MNYRTQEVRRLAPRANVLRLTGLFILSWMLVVSLAKLFGDVQTSWETIGYVALGAFVAFLIGRLRMGAVNATLARKLEDAAG